MPRPFSRHTRGDFTPAQCVRSGHNEELIDLGAEDIIGYGRVYLCIHCAAELIQALGYVDPDVHNAQIEQARKRIEALDESLAQANRSLIELTPNNPQTEEMADGIRAVLDRFVRSRGSAGDALLAVPAPDADIVRPAGDGPDAGDGPAGAGSDERASSSDSGDGAEPQSDGTGDSGDDGGDATPAGDDSEADGGDDLDLLGWIEQGAGAPVADAAVGDDGAGD